jgi:hypothetical protein
MAVMRAANLGLAVETAAEVWGRASAQEGFAVADSVIVC